MTHLPSPSTTPSRGSDPVEAALALLADYVADRVLARLVERPRVAHDYYDQRSNPLGKRRFLEAARRGAFPSTRCGRLVLARREDVDRWLASRTRAKPMTATRDDDDLEKLLADAGLVASAVRTPRGQKER